MINKTILDLEEGGESRVERQREREAGALVCCGLGAHRKHCGLPLHHNDIKKKKKRITLIEAKEKKNFRRGQTFFFLPANPHSELTQKGPRNGMWWFLRSYL